MAGMKLPAGILNGRLQDPSVTTEHWSLASACYLLIESSFSIGNPRQPASRIESWVANK